MTLRVDGHVAHPGTFDFDALGELPGQIADVAFLIPRRSGGAVPLRALLGAVAPRAGATHLTLRAGDGAFSASVPLLEVEHAVLLYRSGGVPLDPAEGGPVRFLIPEVEHCALGGVDACANVKDLVHIEVGTRAGDDTRPLTEAAHTALHENE